MVYPRTSDLLCNICCLQAIFKQTVFTSTNVAKKCAYARIPSCYRTYPSYLNLFLHCSLSSADRHKRNEYAAMLLLAICHTVRRRNHCLPEELAGSYSILLRDDLV